MRDEPKIFKYLSAFFFLLSMSFPFQAMYLTDLSILQFPLAFNYLSDINLILMLNFLLISIGFLFSHTVTALLLIISIPLVALNNYHISMMGAYHNSSAPFVSSVFYVLVFLLFIQSNQFRALADSKFQWWRTSPRYHVKLKTYLHINNQKIELETINISESGALLKSYNLAKYITTFQNGVGADARLEIEFDGIELKSSKVEIVRVSNEMQNFGALALQFKEQSYLFQKSIKSYINRLENSMYSPVTQLCEKIENTI